MFYQLYINCKVCIATNCMMNRMQKPIWGCAKLDVDFRTLLSCLNVLNVSFIDISVHGLSTNMAGRVYCCGAV